MFTHDPGFTSTSRWVCTNMCHPVMYVRVASDISMHCNGISCQSAITFIDGESGVLLHRGYSIEDLAKHSDYIEAIPDPLRHHNN